MNKAIYPSVRDLHLYLGLFVSPFILVFATSVFFLNHGKLARAPQTPAEIFHDVQVPVGIDQLEGREAVDRARAILPQVGLTGEIGFLRVLRKERRLVFPVSRPGLEATVEVDLGARTAAVTRRQTGWWESLAYLHKSPGPHNVAIRGNWVWTRVWKWFADTTIYLTLFITISGVYLWYAIKAERTIGLILLSAGAVTFFGIIYAVVR